MQTLSHLQTLQTYPGLSTTILSTCSSALERTWVLAPFSPTKMWTCFLTSSWAFNPPDPCFGSVKCHQQTIYGLRGYLRMKKRQKAHGSSCLSEQHYWITVTFFAFVITKAGYRDTIIHDPYLDLTDADAFKATSNILWVFLWTYCCHLFGGMMVLPVVSFMVQYWACCGPDGQGCHLHKPSNIPCFGPCDCMVYH